MEELSWQKLRETNVKRCETAFNHKLNEWSHLEWAAAAAGELGELINKLKKRHRSLSQSDKEVTDTDIAHEIADTILYLDLLAASLGIDTARAIKEKFDLVSLRPECPSNLKLGESLMVGAFIKYRAPNGSVGQIIGETSDYGPRHPVKYYVRYYYGKDLRGEPMVACGSILPNEFEIISAEQFYEIANRKSWASDQSRVS